jgi:hypothetical protein
MSHPHQKRTGAHNAMYAVRWAQLNGVLKPPTDFDCTDCGNPAQVYDHRDYNKPFDVEPVCLVCNYQRGAAIPSDRDDPPNPKATDATGFVLCKQGIGRIAFEAVDFYPKTGRSKVAAWRVDHPEIEAGKLLEDQT